MAVGRLWTAAVIYKSADSFISPRELRGRVGAEMQNPSRKQAFRASRAPPQRRPKLGILCPISAHFMPNSAPFHKSPRSAFSPAGRGFWRLSDKAAAYGLMSRINHFFSLSCRSQPAAQGAVRQAALTAAAPVVARLRAAFRPTGEPTLSPRRLARNRWRLGRMSRFAGTFK